MSLQFQLALGVAKAIEKLEKVESNFREAIRN
jgi:hypothetical protein